MLIDEYIEICVTARTVNYYKAKGYIIPMRYSEKSQKNVIDPNVPIKVKTTDLSPSSHVRIKYKCDSCGDICETDYHSWCHATYPELGDLCKRCAIQIKLPKVMQDKYGEANAANVQSVIEKKKKTNLDKYGNEWAIASNEVRQASKLSYLKTFGVDNPMKHSSIRQKAKDTNNERYGGNSPVCDDTVKEKAIVTCQEKYGVSNPYQCKDIQAKARQTLYRNGNVPTSKAECKMCGILENLFGIQNCVRNYTLENLSLDCLVNVDGILIDFEYDGVYWHKDRGHYDAARNAVLMDMGYKIIRIKANNQDTMPTEQQIKDVVDYLVKGNHHLAFINMNE